MRSVYKGAAVVTWPPYFILLGAFVALLWSSANSASPSEIFPVTFLNTLAKPMSTADQGKYTATEQHKCGRLWNGLRSSEKAVGSAANSSVAAHNLTSVVNPRSYISERARKVERRVVSTAQ